MITLRWFHNCVVAAFALAIAAAPLPLRAQTDRLDSLFEELAQPGLPNWQRVEEDFVTAIEHFTALIDHAPEFAEGYNARATAFFRQGLYGPSMADIRATLALNPRHFGALIGLGAIMEEVGEPEKALSAYGAAAAIHPNEPDLKEAVERLQKAVSGTTL
jgi:tetratricopeptide (TPR) repeat protein